MDKRYEALAEEIVDTMNFHRDMFLMQQEYIGSGQLDRDIDLMFESMEKEIDNERN